MSDGRYFPDDYSIETLRGLPVPNRRRALRALARRSQWLMRKIEEHAKLGRFDVPGAPRSFELDELAAIAALVDATRDEPADLAADLADRELLARSAVVGT